MRQHSGPPTFLAVLLAATTLLSACSGLSPAQRRESPPPAWNITATNLAPAASETSEQTLDSRPTPDSLIPTLIPVADTPTPVTGTTSSSGSAGSPEPASSAVTSTIEASPAPLTTPSAQASIEEPDHLRSRLGVGVPLNVTDFEFDEPLARRLGVGWYLDWHVQAQPLRRDGLDFAQMVRVRGSRFFPSRTEIAHALAANPGSLWLIGNEPDVPWQDNTTPEDYAQRYHELAVFITTLDPSAQLAIGGVSQVTPLRLSYLERVLAAYERQYGAPMPVDVWNIHTFMLREERDSWGVSIPPGFDDVQQGMLWEIEDHDDLDLMRQQIVDFRRWMTRHGQRDKPLIVSEYGILMPEEYGFPPESVEAFMRQSFDLFLTERDPEIGYPPDDDRLVQRFVWYSLSDTTYPTSNLVEPKTGDLTPLGEAFVDYAGHLDVLP